MPQQSLARSCTAFAVLFPQLLRELLASLMHLFYAATSADGQRGRKSRAVGRNSAFGNRSGPAPFRSCIDPVLALLSPQAINKSLFTLGQARLRVRGARESPSNSSSDESLRDFAVRRMIACRDDETMGAGAGLAESEEKGSGLQPAAVRYSELCGPGPKVISQLSQGKAERPISQPLCTLDLFVCLSVLAGRSEWELCAGCVVCGCGVYGYTVCRMPIVACWSRTPPFVERPKP